MNHLSSHSTTPRRPRSIWLCACLLMAACAWGCQPSSSTETSTFEQAEIAYREGSYRRALDSYERFLERYPRSPLAATARMRIRCINREVQAMLGRTGTPRPLYLGEGEDATAPPLEPPDQVEPPPASE